MARDDKQGTPSTQNKPQADAGRPDSVPDLMAESRQAQPHEREPQAPGERSQPADAGRVEKRTADGRNAANPNPPETRTSEQARDALRELGNKASGASSTHDPGSGRQGEGSR
jgi:hypothetical protein